MLKDVVHDLALLLNGEKANPEEITINGETFVVLYQNPAWNEDGYIKELQTNAKKYNAKFLIVIREPNLLFARYEVKLLHYLDIRDNTVIVHTNDNTYLSCKFQLLDYPYVQYNEVSPIKVNIALLKENYV